MKRILIFSLAYVPHVGGAELAVKEITDRLGGEYEFDMVVLQFDKNLPALEKVGSVTVHRIGFTSANVKVSDRTLPWQCKLAKAVFPLTSFWKARALHRANPYDMIWGLMANQAGFGALFFKLAYSRVPYFLELQDGTPLALLKKRPFLRLFWPMYSAVYKKADRIKAISHFIENLARDVGYTGRVEIIPNGVDVARFSEPIDEDELNRLKQKLGKKMGDVFLFTASRLVLSRGVEDIIRALPHLPENVKLLIAGEGDDRGKLEGIAKDAGVAERLIFLGHIAHEKLPQYFKVSDIFVRPSLIEGMGSAFIEAFAAGIPVVATPVGGIPDFLSDPDKSPDDEPTGLFCNIRDSASIARAVRRYIEDPVLTARIVKNAHELAARTYDWNTIARGMRERMFEKLL